MQAEYDLDQLKLKRRGLVGDSTVRLQQLDVGSKVSRVALESEQELKKSFDALQAAIDIGLNSGVSPRTMEEIWLETERLYNDV